MGTVVAVDTDMTVAEDILGLDMAAGVGTVVAQDIVVVCLDNLDS